MSNLMNVGKRIIPVEHVALIESYILNAESRIRTSREFKSRIVLLNGDSVLSETAPGEMAEVYSFRMMPKDGVATNPAIRFRVEQFEPAENFKPSKDYLTRLSWTDLDGNSRSKLLMSSPETVLSIAVRGDDHRAPPEAPKPTTRSRRRRLASRANVPGP